MLGSNLERFQYFRRVLDHIRPSETSDDQFELGFDTLRDRTIDVFLQVLGEFVLPIN
jgi:hypothetical protein